MHSSTCTLKNYIEFSSFLVKRLLSNILKRFTETYISKCRHSITGLWSATRSGLGSDSTQVRHAGSLESFEAVFWYIRLDHVTWQSTFSKKGITKRSKPNKYVFCSCISMVFYFIFARNDESAWSCVEQVRAKTSNGWGEFSESASARTYSQNDASTPSAGTPVTP